MLHLRKSIPVKLICASNGDRKLGGSDVDDLLVELALAEFRKEGLEISTQDSSRRLFFDSRRCRAQQTHAGIASTG